MSTKWLNKLTDDQKKRITPQLGFQLSLDGPEAIHDKIRGVKGNFQKVLEAVGNLRKAGFKDIRFGFTISDSNVEYATEIYDLAEKLGVEFTAEIVQNSSNYFGIESNDFKKLDELKKQLNHLIKKDLLSFSVRK